MISDFLTAIPTTVGLAILVLAPLIPAIPRAIGETNDLMSKSAYEVTGHVKLFHVDLAETLEDGSGVVVWLSPTQTGQKPQLSTPLPHYRMMQHHKMFEPHLLVVPEGSIVEFPNHDPWFHNVFSVSRSRRFDLGLYRAGVQKAVRFDRAGASYLFCSIHPEMTAVVLTVDSTYFGVSEKTGHISIGNVPPGKYFLHIWYENATPQTLEALRRAIFVGDGGRNLPTISIALSNRIPMAGKNEKQRSSPLSGRELETTMTEQNWPGTFEQKILPHLDTAYNLARWLTRREQDAEDVVQEAYLRAFRFFAGFRGGDARPWLMKIVRNTCYTWLHANRPLQDATEFDENLFAPDSRAPNPEEAVLQNDSGTLVRKALEKLPPNFREVLILRELEGMSYREIADITGMPAGTVMSSVSRARGCLRQALTGLMNGRYGAKFTRIAAANT
jgi:RNA polymerase sigma-70 factor, ECF subfamily